MTVVSRPPSGQGPRKPASPDKEPNFYSMDVIPVTVTKPVPAPPICSIPPTTCAPPTKKHQDDHGSETTTIRGSLPVWGDRPEKLSWQKQQQQQQQQKEPTCTSFCPAATPSNSKSEDPEVQEAFHEGCAFGFAAATSMALMGRSITPNQADAQEGVRFTTIKTNAQPMTSSCNRIQDNSQVLCRQERHDCHFANRGIFALEDDLDFDFDIDFDPLMLLEW
jgi:hypothetical protein